jgi:hypothetical protein
MVLGISMNGDTSRTLWKTVCSSLSDRAFDYILTDRWLQSSGTNVLRRRIVKYSTKYLTIVVTITIILRISGRSPHSRVWRRSSASGIAKNKIPWCETRIHCTLRHIQIQGRAVDQAVDVWTHGREDAIRAICESDNKTRRGLEPRGEVHRMN